MKRYFTFLMLLITTSAFAQQTGNITGTLSGNGRSIESASVTLLRQKDSSLVKVAVSDKNGIFSFEKIAFGNYLVSVSSVGYERFYSNPITLSADNSAVNMGVQSLKAQDNSLAEVTVTSKKPFLEMKADKMVVNVDASPSNAGNTALEVLEKSPGVSVDRDGNISLKGKQGVIVLLDGRQTFMSSEDLANMGINWIRLRS